MTGHDYAHTQVAADRRHTKARRLRLAAILAGLTVDELRAVIHPDALQATRRERLLLRKAAGLDREPSTETWQAALVELEREPARIVDEATRDRPAPCGCWPARDTGVLYEFPPTPRGPLGWPCCHYPGRGDPDAMRGAIGCARGTVAPSAQDVATVNAFADQLTAHVDLADDPDPVVSESPVDADPWWA